MDTRPPTLHLLDSIIASLQSGKDDVVKYWHDQFASIFGFIQGFFTKYTADSPDLGVRIEATAPILWAQLCQICFPTKANCGAPHVRFLLKEPESRAGLAARVTIEYILTHMLSLESWLGFEAAVDTEIQDIDRQLRASEKFRTYERQELLDRQATMIMFMMKSPQWAAYNQFKTAGFKQGLKLAIGALVAVDKKDTQGEALFDLHQIAEMAWALSQKTMLSRLSFHYDFSEVCTKFNIDKHNPVSALLPPQVLHQRQARIKLAITPSITMRKEDGMSIVPKHIMKSNVLVMD